MKIGTPVAILEHCILGVSLIFDHCVVNHFALIAWNENDIFPEVGMRQRIFKFVQILSKSQNDPHTARSVSENVS